MKHAPPTPHSDLWSTARELLAAFTHVWGAAKKIALQWTMFDEHVVEALKALAPIEALARRLVFAQALTIKLKPPAPKRIVVKAPKHVSPFTFIPLDPLAFRKSLEPPPPFIHLKPPHELEKPPEEWRVRFHVARLAPKLVPPASAGPATQDNNNNGRLKPALQRLPREPGGGSRGDPEKIRAAARRRYAQKRAAAEQADYDYWHGPYDPNAPREEVVYTWKPPEKISTETLARRAEALRRVIENPTRYARALARRLTKHRPQVARIVRKLHRRCDEPCRRAMQCIDDALPAFQDTS